MKVLWLSHFVPYPPKGGMLSRSYNLLREVSKYHEVYLLSFVQSKPLLTMFPSLDDGLREANEQLSSFCQHVEFVNIPAEGKKYGNHRLALSSLFSKLPYTINWLESEDMSARLASLLKDNDFDLVHFDTISLVPYSEQMPELSKVLNHHNIESHMLLRRISGEKVWLKKAYFYLEGLKLKAYEKKYCGNFLKNITCSPLDSMRLLEIDPSLDAVDVCNGVDIDYFQPHKEKMIPSSLIFVGGLNWYPNRAAMDFFISEVWPELKKVRPELVIDVVGQDPPPEYLAMAEKDSAFRVRGFVDDVREYMDRAAVYVCPIDDGGGTKLKVLDALAMKMALVANPVACEGIDVVNGESVLYATTAQEYVKSILQLIDNDELIASLGANGRSLICEKYSYESLGKKLSGVYLSACS